MTMIDPKLLSSFFDSILTGIYVLNRDGDYIYANGAFLKMSGGEKGDLPHLNAFRMVEEGYVKESAAVRAFEEKRQITLVSHVNNQKGYQYHQIITATPIFDGSGEIEYMIVEMMNLHTLERQMESGFVGHNERLRIDKISGGRDPQPVIAVSPNMQEVVAMATEIAAVDSTVLLTGETGTGKDVLAHYIHEHSSRKDKPMLAINCAALPENLLESELFGYEKGAYTGALNTGKQGLIQRANGGTLFLDEVNSIPLSVQSKLLRVLETKRVKRLGALEEEEVDFRLLAATNQDLQACVDAGTFRPDLYYRMSVVPIEIPPLRERRADIIPLALRFLDRYCRRYDRTKIMTVDALNSLVRYDWPGNVRELKNVIERVVVSSLATTVEVKQLPDNILGQTHSSKPAPAMNFPLDWELFYQNAPDQFSLKSYMDFCEAQVIEGVLRHCGNTREAARLLKTDQSTVVRKRQKYRKKAD